MQESIVVDGKIYSPIIHQYELRETIDFYDGPLSGSVVVGKKAYFYYRVDETENGHPVYRVVKTTSAELNYEIAQCGQPLPPGKVLSREEQYALHETIGYIVW